MLDSLSSLFASFSGSLTPGLAAALAALLAMLVTAGLATLLARRRQADRQRRHRDLVAGLEARLTEGATRFDELRSQLQASEVTRARLESELTHQRQRAAERQRLQEQHHAERLRLLHDSRDQLKQEFENLANEILERKGRAFSALSEQRLGGLLQPIQAEMKGFRDKVETLHRVETEQRASLRTELRHLQALNREITDQAHRLTEALQGQKKLQGNWGELMLENVLEGSGLRPGQDYKREESFATEEGRRRPDAVVALPQGRHLVIDAKTSLSAYVRYVNAEDEIERHRALAEHARAVAARIDELADKHYYALPGLNSPEVVVMFIPVESAYVEALRYDETLFQRAIERNVLVATPTTLLTSLNIVRQLWRFEDQSRHGAELADRAEKFYNKLRLFLESMQDVGRKIDGARESYDEAMNRLISGRGNLIKQAAEFKELGVAVRRELPAELVERAGLELGRGEPAGTHKQDAEARDGS